MTINNKEEIIAEIMATKEIATKKDKKAFTEHFKEFFKGQKPPEDLLNSMMHFWAIQLETVTKETLAKPTTTLEIKEDIATLKWAEENKNAKGFEKLPFTIILKRFDSGWRLAKIYGI